jgi:hypothetical protein
MHAPALFVSMQKPLSVAGCQLSVLEDWRLAASAPQWAEAADSPQLSNAECLMTIPMVLATDTRQLLEPDDFTAKFFFQTTLWTQFQAAENKLVRGRAKSLFQTTLQAKS